MSARTLALDSSHAVRLQRTIHEHAQANIAPHKSPALAWALSLLVPGGGQGYNGQWGKGAIFFGVVAVGMGIYVQNGGGNCIVGQGENCGAASAGAFLAVGGWIGSQIDAPLTAAAINRRTGGAARQATLTVARIRF